MKRIRRRVTILEKGKGETPRKSKAEQVKEYIGQSGRRKTASTLPGKYGNATQLAGYFNVKFSSFLCQIVTVIRLNKNI